jgi:hypothetical protein
MQLLANFYMIRIYDAGRDSGLTYNWGVEVGDGNPTELGKYQE